jgi:hypothetical protein
LTGPCPSFKRAFRFLADFAQTTLTVGRRDSTQLFVFVFLHVSADSALPCPGCPRCPRCPPCHYSAHFCKGKNFKTSNVREKGGKEKSETLKGKTVKTLFL